MPIPTFTARPQSKGIVSLETGLEARDAAFWRGVGNTASAVTNFAVNAYKEDVVDKSAKAGALAVEQGLDLRDLPQENTAAAKAFRKSAESAYMANLTTESTLKLNEFKVTYNANPAKLNEVQQEYIDGIVENLPITARAGVNQSLQVSAAGDLSGVTLAFNKKELEKQKQESIYSLTNKLNNLSRAPVPQTEAQQIAMNQDVAQAGLMIGDAVNNGYITGLDAANRLQKLNTQRARLSIGSVVNKAFAVSIDEGLRTVDAIYDGKTGVEFIDNLTTIERSTMAQEEFNKSMNLTNNQLAAESRADTQKVELQESNHNALYKVAALEKDPESKAVAIEAALQTAETPKQIKEINALDNAVKASIETSDTVDIKIAILKGKGDLTDQILDDLLADGKISADDYTFNKNYVSELPNELMGSPIMDTFKLQYNELFPALSSGALLNAAIMGVGAADTQQIHSEIQASMQIELNNMIQDGIIGTTRELNIESQKILNEYRNTFRPKKEGQIVPTEALSIQDQHVFLAKQKNPEYLNYKNRIVKAITPIENDKTLKFKEKDKKIQDKIRSILSNVETNNGSVILRQLKLEGVID